MNFSVNLNGALTVFDSISGTVHTLQKDTLNYNGVLQAIKNNDSVALNAALNSVQNTVSKFAATSNGAISVDVANSVVTYNGVEMHNNVTQRMLEFVRAGLPVEPLIKFLQNFLENPMFDFSKITDETLSVLGLTRDEVNDKVTKFVDDFYAFVSHRNLPIDENGCFLAYKTVDQNYWSKRGGKLELVHGKTSSDGKVYNGIGSYIECKREDVDSNRHAECSYGLHVGCLDYSGPGGWYNSAGDKVVIVSVNPKDVIAVPPDHNRTKMRVCAYKVVADFKSPLNKPLYDTADVDSLEESDDIFDADDVFVEDLATFDVVSFDYKGKRRYVEVHEVTDGLLQGMLVEPEVEVGGLRAFKVEQISSISFEE